MEIIYGNTMKKYIYGLIIGLILGYITDISHGHGIAGGSGLVSVPAVDISTVVTLSGTETLTNKTLHSDTNTIQADTVYVGSRNVSGSTITAGSPVYASGYNAGQDKVEINPSDANVLATMPAIGIVESDILNNANGHVIASGVFNGLDTTGTSEGESWSVGDSLYVSAILGELTNIKPTGSTELIQVIAKVVRSHATLGRILVQGAGRMNDVPNVISSINTNITAKTSAYTTVALDHTIICGAGNETFTVTLIAAVNVIGQILYIKNIGTGIITVDGNTTETIDGAITLTLSIQYASITIQSDGSNWHIF